MFAFNFFAIFPLVSSLLITGIGSYILYRNFLSKLHQAFFCFCLSFFVWLFSFSLMYSAIHAPLALKLARVGFIGIAFIPFNIFYFCMKLLRIENKKWQLTSLFAVSCLLSILSQTHWIYKDVYHHVWGYYPIAGDLLSVFIAYYFLIWFYTLRLLYEAMIQKKAAGDFISHHQIKYIFVAWAGQLVCVVDFLPKYGLGGYPFAYFVDWYWIFVMAYMLVQYRMKPDVHLTTRQVFVISCFFAVSAALVSCSSSFIRWVENGAYSAHVPMIAVSLSIAIGFVLYPLFKRLKVLVDKTLFPDYQQDQHEKAIQVREEIGAAKNADELGHIVISYASSWFRVFKIMFYVWDEKENIFQFQCGSGCGMNLQERADQHFQLDHPIVQYLLQGEKYLLVDDIRKDFAVSITPRSLMRALLEEEISLCLPIEYDNGLKGILMLGEKESGLSYRSRDVKTLKELADYTAKALERFQLQQLWRKEVNQNQKYSDVIRQHLNPTIAHEIIRTAKEHQSWKGERRHVTILLADLRGFTKMTEQYELEEITEYLNAIYPEMGEIVESYGGHIDKYMGDAMLVVFGIPVALRDSELRSVSCAIEMQNALQVFNQKRQQEGLLAMDMGIGISSGQVIAGHIGSTKRSEFTVIGDAVNIAARLQDLAKPGQILVSADAKSKIHEKIKIKDLGFVQVQGKSQPLEIIEVAGFKTEADPKINYGFK